MAARKKKPQTRFVLVQLSHGNPEAQLQTSAGKVSHGQTVELPADEAERYIERGLVVDPDGH